MWEKKSLVVQYGKQWEVKISREQICIEKLRKVNPLIGKNEIQEKQNLEGN